MISQIYEHYLVSRKISTDTRRIDKGSIFFALRGPNFDANTFAEKALENGAAIAVIDNVAFKKDERYVVVDDSLSALQELARYHRNKLDIPVIGLTGSNGKTTSKELIHAVLATKYNVLATAGNLNNHIGVPLTILDISPEHEIAIIEMGANHVGEIAFLCSIALPTHGFITNIGKAHLEGFGGIEGVIRGKSELYQHLINTKGIVWINSQDNILFNMAKRFENPVFFPGEDDYYHCSLANSDYFLEVVAENKELIKTQLTGTYNFNNVAIALTIAKYFEVPERKANAGIADYRPENNRSQIVEKGSNKIILDAYNANPDSMAAAINNMASLKKGKKVVILGDMKELGTDSTQEHENLGTETSKLMPDMVYLCGPEIEAAMKTLPNALHFANRDELIHELKTNPIKDALILVKASRSIGLEKIIDYL